jgi:hypothetical protein
LGHFPLSVNKDSGMKIEWILGIVLACGVWYAGYMAQPQPPMVLNAVAGFGTENFAMCTGRVDDSSEGVFTLDYLTGDLQCHVLNPRTGKWGAKFKRNIANDLQVDRAKKPAFILTTGMSDFPRGGNLQRPSGCVVYVADANSGKIGAYMIPWTPGALAAGQPQWGEFVPLDSAAARNVEVRE